jgi:hypothetical protein
MAIELKPRSKEQYGRLMGMLAPEATPSKRVGTEAPTGSVAAGPRAGQTAEQFTKAGSAPGAAFSRQLKGANIGGITALAEQPLLREAGQEATRVAQEGIGYKTGQQQYREKQPQFKFGEKETPDVLKKIAEGDEGATETAQQILSREKIDVPEFTTADIKEFTPLQALRGGSVESLLRKEAAGPYTTGMAGLDALLFQKKGGAPSLATKGVALRTAGQAAADALEKQLTEEARKEAAELVEGQKTQLRHAVSAGLRGREEAQSEAVKARNKTIADLQANQLKAMQVARDKYIENEKTKIREAVAKEMRSQLAREEEARLTAAAEGSLKDVIVPSPLAFKEQALRDPRYAYAVERAIRGAEPTFEKLQVTPGKAINVGFENVMSADDLAQYNRLQQLIGGQTVSPRKLPIGDFGAGEQVYGEGAATFDVSPVAEFMRNYERQDFIPDYLQVEPTPAPQTPPIITTPALPLPAPAQPIMTGTDEFGFPTSPALPPPSAAPSQPLFGRTTLPSQLPVSAPMQPAPQQQPVFANVPLQPLAPAPTQPAQKPKTSPRRIGGFF